MILTYYLQSDEYQDVHTSTFFVESSRKILITQNKKVIAFGRSSLKNNTRRLNYLEFIDNQIIVFNQLKRNALQNAKKNIK